MSTLCCRSCEGTSFSDGLNLGPQPVSNRFKISVDELVPPEPRYPLCVIQCTDCGLIQLKKSFPAKELCPRFEWIKYRERESHLDRAVRVFSPLLRKDKNLRTAVGISDYDQPLLDRLGAELGIATERLSAQNDLGITLSFYGSETLQTKLTPARGRKIAEQGAHQLLVSRYLLEHAQQPREMLACFRELLDEEGWLLLEVPDAMQPLAQLDYPVIWEEHVTYFTEATIRSLLHRSGFSVAEVFLADSKFERSMLVLARRDDHPAPAPPPARSEMKRFDHFVSSFPVMQKRFEDFCLSKKKEGRALALLGAGHFACAFANYFRLTPYLSFVADDDINKANHFLPGTSLEILPTSNLKQNRAMLALLCVNPDGEERIVPKIAPILGKNTGCLSIFSTSARFCLEDADAEPYQEIAPGAFVSRLQPVVANAGTIAWLKDQAALAPKRRARLCAHLSPSAPLHEMIIVLLRDGYIRPHRHFNKSESMHVMEGRAAIIYFTDEGKPLSLRFLGREGKNDNVFCRTEREVYHTVLVLTPSFVFHETVQGPFQAEDTEYAPWSPSDDDDAGVAAFTKRFNDLSREAAKPDCAWAAANL